MTKLLLHLFVPNASEHTPAAHAAVGKLAGAVGIVCNVLLACLKIAAGLLSDSVAMAGDGINNLTDCASSVVTLLGFRMAQRPADGEHPFGHGMSIFPAWWYPPWCCWQAWSWGNPPFKRFSRARRFPSAL